MIDELSEEEESEEEEDEVESDGVSLGRCIAFQMTRADSISCCHYETSLSLPISLNLRRSPLSTLRTRLMHTSMDILRPPPRIRSETGIPFLSVSHLSRPRPRSTGFPQRTFSSSRRHSLPLPPILRPVIPLSSFVRLSPLAIPTQLPLRSRHASTSIRQPRPCSLPRLS